jgi:hypothetical protein
MASVADAAVRARRDDLGVNDRQRVAVLVVEQDDDTPMRAAAGRVRIGEHRHYLRRQTYAGHVGRYRPE